MKFETAKEYIEYLDEQSGESWSNATDELADVMEDYAKMYHERQLKLLGIANVVGQSEQLADDTVTFERKSKPMSKYDLNHPNLKG